MRVPHDWQKDPFPGICPYHGDCLEGLACGPALEKRWGRRANLLEPGHSGWEIEADYIAAALANLVFTVGPERIIIGGGVPGQPRLLRLIRSRLSTLLGGYSRPQCWILALNSTSSGDDAGVLGAIAMAELSTRDVAGGQWI